MPPAAEPLTKRRAVDQHQRPLRREIAQVDLGRTGADAGAVRRAADIAGIVDLGVEAAAGAGQALQHIGDRAEAGPRDGGFVDRHDRLVLVERVAADTRSGNDDVVGRACAIGGGRFLRLCGNGGQAGDERQRGNAGEFYVFDSVHEFISSSMPVNIPPERLIVP